MMNISVLICFLEMFATFQPIQGTEFLSPYDGATANNKKLEDLVDAILDLAGDFDKRIAIFKHAKDFAKSVFNLLSPNNSDGKDEVVSNLLNQHKEVMKKLEEISHAITDLSETVKYDIKEAVYQITDSIEMITPFILASQDLSNKMESVNSYYLQSMELHSTLKNGTQLNRITLEDFVDRVFRGPNNIKDLLDSIHYRFFRTTSLFISGDYVETHQTYFMTNYGKRCDKNISPHQRLFYIYVALMVTKFQGSAVLAHGYHLRTILSSSFEAELTMVKNDMKKRLNDYRNKIRESLQLVDNDIRRCEPKEPKRDSEFLGPRNLPWCIYSYRRRDYYRVSISDTVTDINDNMIVSGIKLVVKDNILQINVKQGKLDHSGLVSDNDVWKGPLDQETDDLNLDQSVMYIDDVIVDSNYVVTGIKFKRVNTTNGWKIVVRGTRYNFTTGLLMTNDTKWFDPEQEAHRSQDYDRHRERILRGDVDNPIYAPAFESRRTTNLISVFEPTSLEKDAGQTTIPFIDLQSVTMMPAFPLNGIGLFYKGADGFGGYLSFRLFTDTVDKYI